MCRVPIEAKEEIEALLKEMTAQDIITPQMELIHRISSLTYPVKSNETMRVCLDTKDLNKTIMCKYHKALTLEEITYRLAGSTKCSKLDVKYVFGAFILRLKSSLLITFNSHLGRYTFKCMPFSLKMSRDIFQMNIDQIVERCLRVLCIHNDLCIYGKLEREHNLNLISFM